MEILNYDQQPAGSYAIGIFDVDMRPAEKRVYKRLKLCKSKKGTLFVSFPAYKKGEGENGKGLWENYVEFTDSEELKELNRSILEAVKPFTDSVLPF